MGKRLPRGGGMQATAKITATRLPRNSFFQNIFRNSSVKKEECDVAEDALNLISQTL
jgi:hypothetical protein